MTRQSQVSGVKNIKGVSEKGGVGMSMHVQRLPLERTMAGRVGMVDRMVGLGGGEFASGVGISLGLVLHDSC
jgi:hypothetical protein